MRILVTGAYGFIGSHIVSALQAAGHEVRCAVRRPDRSSRFAHLPTLQCDLARDTRAEDWIPRLRDVDAVVNAAGILRESRHQRFAAIHHLAPLALFKACASAGVRKVVQISALGDPRDGEFVRTKHALDAELATLDLDWVILRPSIVYSPQGSYGGTSLLRALAALPGILFVPGDGRQAVQPIAAEDLGRAVLRLVESDAGNQHVLEAAGPAVVSFADFLLALRCWLGFGRPWVWRVPAVLVRPLARMAEWLGRGPFGVTMFKMLERGNVAAPGAAATFAAAVGFVPRSVEQVLMASPSHVQDRWHARLYLLAPVLRATLALLWLGSAGSGFRLLGSEEEMLALITGIPAPYAAAVVLATSVFDLVLGILILTRYVRLAIVFMLLSVLAYTLFLGLMLPELWLAPNGALLKNLPLLPALLALHVLSDRR